MPWMGRTDNFFLEEISFIFYQSRPVRDNIITETDSEFMVALPYVFAFIIKRAAAINRFKVENLTMLWKVYKMQYYNSCPQGT